MSIKCNRLYTILNNQMQGDVKMKNTDITERLNEVRRIMSDRGIDVYMVCTGDYHMSEYAGEYFGEREYLSGFTGSAGTLVVDMEEAVLFTDGRYFVQAEKELEGTGIKLMKSGTAKVPTVTEYCVQKVTECGGTVSGGAAGSGGVVLGMDGRTVSASLGMELVRLVESKGAKVDATFNAIEEMWKDRPAFPASEAYEIECGESRASKITRVKEAVSSVAADCHVIASLDDICWLFNIRGADVIHNPVIMAYVLIKDDKVVLYSDEKRFSEELKGRFKADGVKIEPYNKIYEDCMGFQGKVLVDSKRVNYALINTLIEAGAKIVDKENPTVLMKAVKNEYEIDNLRKVHIEDGLAVTKFIYWVKQAVKDVGKAEKNGGNAEKNCGEVVTEVTAARYLDELRSQIKDYKDLSFDTISAYGANGAMMHYHATKEACSELKTEGMLLVDSGGQYLRGTTDVTRTIALGPVSDEMRKHYTLTLKGMLALADAHFLRGCTGYNLDILARQPLWEIGMDYRCGTGHGIGYMLNVHEAPNGFRWKHVIGRNDLCVIEPGMVTSNEPGVYIDGEYGIRIENEIVCVKDYENEYGEFLKFEPLTCVPLEPELVDVSLFDKKDKERLNNYNNWVYTLLSPYLEGDELEFLKNVTKRIE